MTREEQILDAAREYNNGITLSSPSNVLHFESGAKWADENLDLSTLWHDTSEEPQGEYEILWQDIFGYTDRTDYTEVDNRYAGEWGECVDHEGIVRWAYISDLLPKQFGISDQLKKDKEKKN